MSNILIEILAEFTGKKAFKQADTAAATLAKSAKKLGAALGIAFSARAVVQYTKAASIAAAQDQKAQQLLAINLKNLGLAYANLDSEKFIANLEKQSGILDDELRPAYSQLARVTGSIATTQKLMTIAFDASNGSGLSYASTIDILSQAYVGNQKGLKQLNLGYTAAELKGKSFDEILQIITNRFAGAGEAALSGYAGQMQKLEVATSNAAETLGGAFLDAFKSIAGGGDIDQATSKIDKFSEGLAGVIRVLTGVNSLEAMLKDVEWTGFLGLVPVAPKLQSAQSPGDRKAIDAAAKKAEEIRAKMAKDALRRERERLALLDKQNKAKKLGIAIDKANLALNKGTDIFNMDAIQLNAAMINQAEQLGKVTNTAQLLAITNDIARIKIKQDMLALEAAIASKDEAAIIAATEKLNKDLLIFGALQNQNLELADIKSILDSLVPKDLINQTNLDLALAKIKAMLALLSNMLAFPTISGTTGVSDTNTGRLGKPGINYNPTQNADRNYDNNFTNRVLSTAGVTYNPNQNRDRNYDMNITINTGVGDPNAIAEALDQYLQGAVDRGTLRLR